MDNTEPVQPPAATPPPPADPKPIPAPIPSDGSILTQEQASKLLRRDVANLVKKVTNGKPLTSTERALVQSSASGSDLTMAKAWAVDQVELGEILGITRKTVQRWRKEGAPDAESNGRWSLAGWRAWMAQHGKKGGDEKESAIQSRSQLEAKRLLLMNDKLEIEIGILKSEFTRNSEIEHQIKSMVVECRKAGEQMPASLAPQLAGGTVPEIEKRLRAWWDDYCLALHTGTYAAKPKRP
jgi:hypothetical protein